MKIGTIVRDPQGFIGTVTDHVPNHGTMVGYYDGAGEALQSMWPTEKLIELYPAPDFDVGCEVEVLEDLHLVGTIIRKGAKLKVKERPKDGHPIHCHGSYHGSYHVYVADWSCIKRI